MPCQTPHPTPTHTTTHPHHPQPLGFAAFLPSCLPAGVAFLSHTKLSGRYVIRCAIGGTHTQGQHVEAAWRGVQRCAAAILAAAAAAEGADEAAAAQSNGVSMGAGD